MQGYEKASRVEPQKYALVGTLLLPLGGLHYFFVLAGGFALLYGMAGLLEKASLEDKKKLFGAGLGLAILGGLWAKHTLNQHGFDVPRLLLTSLISGFGLYLQSMCYTALARVHKKELLELGGLLLVVGSATFWFYVGFLPLSAGVLLIAYSFWRW
ncbi:MAG: hypothetical protein N3C13_05620 [Aquificaceae bacterium]|nr:hypothetical protein [Aquificaceae bacterium]MCX8060659.1 hypothetical protein [Aquificaceae bacterium]MDW8096889.1 hypothetical protein [Aquificaceae bacterium]